MIPKQIVVLWIEKFNNADIKGLIELYAVDAINHQVVTQPLKGRAEIKKLFEIDFARAKMVCVPEMIHEAGEWAILEWRDPLGLRGCFFFMFRIIKLFFNAVTSINYHFISSRAYQYLKNILKVSKKKF